MASKSRAVCWKHRNGHAATVDAIATVFGAHVKHIVTTGPSIYTAKDFKVGIDVPKLLENVKLLTDLVKLDSRGGILAQADCTEALQTVLQQDADAQSTMYGHAIDGMENASETVALTAYMVRVMLSHVRSLFDSNRSADHPLQALFSCMRSPGDSRKVRRTDRLVERQHPFLAYRTEPDSSEGEDEQVSVVTKFYDGKTRKAYMLASDGHQYHADNYEIGEKGFVVAVWWNPPARLELEVVNGRLKSGVIMPILAKKPAAAKKPADADCEESSCDGEGLDVPIKDETDKDDMQASGTDDTDKHDAHTGFEFVAKPRTEGWTVVLRSKDHIADKVQVLSCVTSKCPQNQNVCQQVADLLTRRMHASEWPGLSSPLKDNSCVDTIRRVARAEKALLTA